MLLTTGTTTSDTIEGNTIPEFDKQQLETLYEYIKWEKDSEIIYKIALYFCLIEKKYFGQAQSLLWKTYSEFIEKESSCLYRGEKIILIPLECYLTEEEYKSDISKFRERIKNNPLIKSIIEKETNKGTDTEVYDFEIYFYAREKMKLSEEDIKFHLEEFHQARKSINNKKLPEVKIYSGYYVNGEPRYFYLSPKRSKEFVADYKRQYSEILIRHHEAKIFTIEEKPETE